MNSTMLNDTELSLAGVDPMNENDVQILNRAVFVWDTMIQAIYMQQFEKFNKLRYEWIDIVKTYGSFIGADLETIKIRIKNSDTECPLKDIGDDIAKRKIDTLVVNAKKYAYSTKEQLGKSISRLQLLRQIKYIRKDNPNASLTKGQYDKLEERRGGDAPNPKRDCTKARQSALGQFINGWSSLGSSVEFRKFTEIKENYNYLNGTHFPQKDTIAISNTDSLGEYIQETDYTIKGSIVPHDTHGEGREYPLINESNLDIIAPVSRDAQDDLSDGQDEQNFFQKLEEISAVSHGEELDTKSTPPLMTDLFSSKGIEDARQKAKILLALRQGQPKFRRDLIKAYKGKCAITGCSIEPVLEAAHILPYLGKESHHVGNGLLLRADLHTLFDISLVHIDNDTFTINIDQLLYGSTYQVLQGKKVNIPKELEKFVSAALRKRKENNF